MTYNKLLKLDARQKIKNGKVTVTNYHGFAYRELVKIGVPTNANESVQNFNKRKPKIDSYDVLIIDEYQDIELEFSDTTDQTHGILGGRFHPCEFMKTLVAEYDIWRITLFVG